MIDSFSATRYINNPILAPTNNDWESKAVFNCATVYSSEDDNIKILYRAVGADGKSRLGLAETKDGYTISYRSETPLMVPENDLEELGIEDPRITKIGSVYYITYVAASLDPECGTKNPFEKGACWRVRTCLASTKDFRKFERHGCILPHMNNKDVVIFPEKVNGKFVMLHRIMPDIWIATSDDLIHWENHEVLMGTGAKGTWDGNRLGAGAPPVKTKAGWLNIYHGVDDDMNYSIGIFLLDLNDPTKVLYRSETPLLSPVEEYEKQGWIPNVCFTCGIIPLDEHRYNIYYGGADQVIGVATCSIEF